MYFSGLLFLVALATVAIDLSHAGSGHPVCGPSSGTCAALGGDQDKKQQQKCCQTTPTSAGVCTTAAQCCGIFDGVATTNTCSDTCCKAVGLCLKNAKDCGTATCTSGSPNQCTNCCTVDLAAVMGIKSGNSVDMCQNSACPSDF